MNGYEPLASSQQQVGRVEPTSFIGRVLGVIASFLRSVWGFVSPILFSFMRIMKFVLSIATPIAWIAAFSGLSYMLLFVFPSKTCRDMGVWCAVIAVLPIAVVLGYVLFKTIMTRSLKKALSCKALRQIRGA